MTGRHVTTAGDLFASTLLGFFVWNYALRHLPASSVASFIYLNPPFAALFGWLLFGEEVTRWFLAGSAIVLAGLWLAQKRPRPGVRRSAGIRARPG